jgi:hypothetical protein
MPPPAARYFCRTNSAEISMSTTSPVMAGGDFALNFVMPQSRRFSEAVAEKPI